MKQLQDYIQQALSIMVFMSALSALTVQSSQIWLHNTDHIYIHITNYMYVFW